MTKAQYRTDRIVLASQGLKQCTICAEAKDRESKFSKDRTTYDGYKTHCKDCVKKYRQENKERMIANAIRWQKENPEKSRASVREWQKRNPEYKTARNNLRRAYINNVPSNFSKRDWEYALDYFQECCAVCGRKAENNERILAADHWIPLSKGGSNTPENIIPLCHGVDGCNNRKGSKDPNAWLIGVYGEFEGKEILVRITNFFSTL